MLHDPHWQTKTEARQILNDAANYLDTHDWCQHAMEHKGAVCLMGALRQVWPGYGRSGPLLTEIISRITSTTKSTIIANWNDDPKRTKRQVIAALRRAAR